MICISDDSGNVNKEESRYDNVLDEFRLALKGIKTIRKEREID